MKEDNDTSSKAKKDSMDKALGSEPNYPPISHFLKRELLQIMPVVGGYIAFQAREM